MVRLLILQSAVGILQIGLSLIVNRNSPIVSIVNRHSSLNRRIRLLNERSSRRSLTLLASIMLLAACDLPTDPRPDFDDTLYPYLVSPRGVRVFGTSRVLVVAAKFADGAPEPLTSSQIQTQLFGSVNGGPVNESFHLASGGAFTLRGQVTRWVTTSVTTAASQQPGVISPSGMEDYVLEALQMVDADIDFGLFDNDGPDGFPNSGDDDGVVDGGVVVLNSDRNRYCDGGTGLGPHPFARSAWRVNGDYVPTQDLSANGGVIGVGGFTVLSATGCGSTGVNANVMAHELGHLFFGLPDLYHAVGGPGEVWAQRRWVLGCWELMAAAAWGCGTGAPTLDYRFNTLGAWTRAVVGWAQPLVVNTNIDATYDLHSLDQGGTVLRVPIRADEYLLLEYRQVMPGDIRLPANGVLIYHIAEALPRFPSPLSGSYRVSLVEADDDSAFFRTEVQGGNRGTAGDAFGISRFSYRSGEHSRATAVDGAPLPFDITEITIDAAGRRARVRISPASGGAGNR